MSNWTWLLPLVTVASACNAAPVAVAAGTDVATPVVGVAEKPKLPSAPGQFGPSLVAVQGLAKIGDQSRGELLSDTESCSTCHVDAAAQWNSSAHSFASFGNPIYRANIEMVRGKLGKEASRHCGGCHDMPLVVDGFLTASKPVPAADLRAHSGVTCRLCHGMSSATSDGNASYVWNARDLDAPVLSDAASIAKHKAAASVKKLGDDLCVSCHRGFLSPDMGMPAHLLGIDEPTAWRSSAYTGNGAMRMDKVDKQTCISCHMAQEPASKDELGAHDGHVASHRFVGAHTWMAAMRGDKEHLQKTQAKLIGAASIDIATARRSDGSWALPAESATLVAGQRIDFDVVIRNLLVGHRFPGGVMDMHDTWIEMAVVDGDGHVLAQSGNNHEHDSNDTQAHVLKSYIADEKGDVLQEHEIPQFRALVANHTVGPREAVVVRYSFAVPRTWQGMSKPVVVRAVLRHRSRSLVEQAGVCKATRTNVGAAFIHGAKGARQVTIDACATQPITEIAKTEIALGSVSHAARASWERGYEAGMALTNVVSERLDEARQVLELARAATPVGDSGAKPRAMIDVQLAWVAAKQGRADDALALVASVSDAIAINKWPTPPVLSFIATDALARVWRWADAIAPAKKFAASAPLNTMAWIMLARVLGSVGDNHGALDAAVSGLAISPRDPDLLRSQAVALAGLSSGDAKAALAAFERFRTPDTAADVRIACAGKNAQCAREREMGHTHMLTPSGK
jgi:hypothetical protein